MILIRLVLIALLMCLCINEISSESKESSQNLLPLTPKAYTKFLRTRRRDHSLLIKTMLKADDYAKNYKMISVALEKIFQVIEQSNKTLIEHSYTPNEGFPANHPKQEAVTLLLENTCLAADLILHFPEISQRILKAVPNWRDTINWCIEFVNSFPHITDELIVELMDLVRQEINEDARSPDFFNPYYERKETTDTTAKKKPKPAKKIKKGPRLTTRNEL